MSKEKLWQTFMKLENCCSRYTETNQHISVLDISSFIDAALSPQRLQRFVPSLNMSSWKKVKDLHNMLHNMLQNMSEYKHTHCNDGFELSSIQSPDEPVHRPQTLIILSNWTLVTQTNAATCYLRYCATYNISCCNRHKANVTHRVSQTHNVNVYLCIYWVQEIAFLC